MYAREFFQPYLETSLRALPHHYRTMKMAKGTVLKFVIEGETDYVAFLYSEGSHWRLLNAHEGDPDSNCGDKAGN